MQIEILEVAGIIPALQALRLPYSREPRSFRQGYDDDSRICPPVYDVDPMTIITQDGELFIHKEDIALANKLIRSGDAHSKVLRGVVAYLRITAPRYWWQEYVTHRVGNECLCSESTMHTISKGVTPDMFDMKEESDRNFMASYLQKYVDEYNETPSDNRPEKEAKFMAIKEHIPESFMQTRIYMVSYQCLRNIWKLRRHHRLSLWSDTFMNAIKQLPLAEQLIFVND